MKHYVRVEGNVVVETLDTDGDIANMFHHDLLWMEADDTVSQGWTYDGENFQPPVELPPQIVIPASVTAAQGGIALIQAGKMDAVEEVVHDPETPAEIRWAWRRAQTWERNSPALAFLAQKAGITDQEMDDLFLAAVALQP